MSFIKNHRPQIHNSITSITSEKWFMINKENDIVLDNGDKIAASELLNTFKYLKDEYPQVFADLILKGIIK